MSWSEVLDQHKLEFNVFMSSMIRGLTFGCAVDITGTLEKSPSQQQRVELQARDLKVVGECNPVASSLFQLIYYMVSE